MKIYLLLLLAACGAVGWAQDSGPTCTPLYEDEPVCIERSLDRTAAPRIVECTLVGTKQVLKEVTVATGGVTTEYKLLPGNRVEIQQSYNGRVFNSTLSVDAYNVTISGECGSEFQFAAIAAQSGFKQTFRPNASVSSPPASGKANDGSTIGDFNNDGVPDSASVTASGIQVTLLNADGSVLSTASYPIAGIGASIAAVDFNNDGILDLAATENDDSGAGNVVVLPGKPNGTFGTPQKFPAGSFAFYLVSADFNSDGAPDLAVSDTPPSGKGNGQVSVLLGKGDGTFAAPVAYTVGPSPATIVAADFTGDGKLDLATLDANTAITNKVWVLPGNGNGTFGTAVSTASGTGSGYLAYADLNHDGKPDLVIADQFAGAAALMLGNGDGSFQSPQEYVVSTQPISIAAIPMGDGNTLILTGDGTDGGLVSNFVISNGTPTMPALQTLGLGPSAIAAGDLNGDHQPDLVIADPQSGKIYVELGKAAGQFGSPAGYTVGSQPAVLALADVNGDGYADVIAGDSRGFNVLLGSASGSLTPAGGFSIGSSVSALTVADFNGDGKPDVAAASASAGGVAIFLGNGDGTFRNGPTVAFEGPLLPVSVASGDLNGDGKTDLVVALNTSDLSQPGALGVLTGKGDGTFQTPVKITLAGPLVAQSMGTASSAALAVGDLNGDGRLDLVTAVQGSAGHQTAVLLGNGNGTFKTPLLAPTNTAPPMIAITDINKDGKPDLVLADCCGLSEASEMFGNGDGTFRAEVRFPSGPSPAGIAVADFDNDGLPDLAVVGGIQSPARGTLALLFNPFKDLVTKPAVTIVSSANPQGAIAPGSLATAYGADLAQGTPGSTSLPLPTSFGGTTLTIVDAAGQSTPAPLLYVSAGQVNFYVPPGVATGTAQVTVVSGDGTQSAGSVQVATVAPGIFALNSANLAAAVGILVAANGAQTPLQVYAVNSAGAVVANPLNLGSASDQVYLELYGTGIQAAGTSNVQVTVAGTSVPVQYAGKSTFTGEDQVNILLPHSLAGAGAVTVQVTAAGVAANPVMITVQ